MSGSSGSSRRDMLKIGVSGIAGAAAMQFAAPGAATADIVKNDERPIILAFMGQRCHNPIFMEMNLRDTLRQMEWRVFFTQYSEFLTPENIGKADVLITLADYYRGWTVGYTPEGLVEERPPAPQYMTPAQETAIIEGVENRGMGYLCLHNSLYAPPERLQAILGHECGYHPPIQPVLYKDLNQEHPITRGLDFWVENDEQFFARVNNPGHTILFNSEGARDHRTTTAGWCFGHGNGRIVAMLPGHTEFVWMHPTWQQLVLRSCMWLMRQPIPDDTSQLVASRRPHIKDVGGFHD